MRGTSEEVTMPKVQPIPAGYHAVTPFLSIAGAGGAIDFYKRAFGAVEKFRMPAPDGKIMHAEIAIGDSTIMLSDAMREPPSAASMYLYVKDADAVFAQAVKAGAQVKIPLADMFWGDRFGTVSDPYGNTWSIATHIEDVPPEEMPKRAQAAMAQMK
jgi:PhnB protein